MKELITLIKEVESWGWFNPSGYCTIYQNKTLQQLRAALGKLDNDDKGATPL